jgi:catechol 2,3-dioxygenase-like lactoylglutathione lyase family enzyme
MKFETNKCIAIHVSDLAAAERFYSGVLNLSLLSKTDTYLEYQTGHFLLYINKDSVASVVSHN